MKQLLNRYKFEISLFLLFSFLIIPLFKSNSLEWLSIFYISAIYFAAKYINLKFRLTFVFLSVLLYNYINLYWLYSTGYYFQISSLIIILSTLYIIPFRFLLKDNFFLFVIYWISADYLMLHLEFSFPLTLIGHHLAFYPEFIQISKIFGVLGVNLLAIIINYLVIGIIFFKNTKFLYLNILLFSFSIFLNIFYLKTKYLEKEYGQKYNCLLLNTDLTCPYEKYEKSTNELKNIYLEKIHKFKDSTNISIVLLPETAFDSLCFIDEIKTNQIIKEFNQTIPSSSFIFGGVLYDYGIITQNHKVNGVQHSIKFGNLYFYNSSFITKDDKHQVRHKNKLVPFNEYLPNFLFLFFQNTEIIKFRHFKRTDHNTRPFSVNEVKVGTGICYESLYGEFMSTFVQNGANVLAFQYNEGWYNSLFGSRKMLANASLRANELNKYVLGSSNCGYSFIINNKGQLIALTSDNNDLYGSFKINNVMTIYSVLGDFLGVISLIILIIMLVINHFRVFKVNI